MLTLDSAGGVCGGVSVGEVSVGVSTESLPGLGCRGQSTRNQPAEALGGSHRGASIYRVSVALRLPTEARISGLAQGLTTDSTATKMKHITTLEAGT